MEKEGAKQSYMQRYAAQVDSVIDRLECNKRTATLRAYTVGAIDLCVLTYLICDFGSTSNSVPMAVIFFLIGLNFFFVVASASPLIKSNIDYKRNVIKAITAGEHPEAEYTHLKGEFNTDTLAYAYGRNLHSRHEDYFRGTAHGLEFRCCECIIRTGGKNERTKFKGLVWRVDMKRKLTSQAIYYTAHPINTGIIPRLKSLCEENGCYTYARTRSNCYLHMPQELWQTALTIAGKNTGDLTMVTEGKYLYIAIRSTENRFEIGSTITEESLAKAARDIAYVVTLPSLLPLDSLMADAMRLGSK